MKRKKLVTYGLFFTGLIILFLFFVFWGTDNWKTSLPTLTTVQPFHFTAENGKPFTNQDMQGKVVVVNYFFTTCKGICPRMNSNVRKVYEEFKNEPDFVIFSHTCDPETDSVARIKQYADSMKVNTAKWVFLTGRKDSLYNMARFSYKIDDPANYLLSEKDDFLHTQFIALINKKGEIVRIY